MKALIIVFSDPEKEFFMVSHGRVEPEDLKGYEGVFIRETIYKSVRKHWLHAVALWILEHLPL